METKFKFLKIWIYLLLTGGLFLVFLLSREVISFGKIFGENTILIYNYIFYSAFIVHIFEGKK
jgi:hypothetical protein